MKNIFILTDAIDPHVDSVLPLLSDHKILRVNTDRYGIEWVVEQHDEQLVYIDLSTERTWVDFDSVWLRRNIALSKFNPVTGYSPSVNQFLTNQNYTVARGAILGIRCPRIMNPWHVSAYMNSKFNHLKAFKDSGIKIPKSLITNNAQKAIAFAKKLGSPIALKQVFSDVIIENDEKTLKYQLTQKILQEDLYKIDPIGPSPMCFQEYVEKKFEYRVTIVGDEIYACRIHSQDAKKEGTKHDWRDYDLANTPHYACTLNTDIERKLLTLAKNCRMNYVAIDLIETPSGEFYGLDINPLGQFQWIEDLTGLPISKAIANWLSC
jgi:hypothetical protein